MGRRRRDMGRVRGKRERGKNDGFLKWLGEFGRRSADQKGMFRTL
jgi:hypothetical protein